MSELGVSSFEAFNSSPEYSRKWANYFPVYDLLFSKYKGLPITFIEVGVLNGGSLFMWRKFLGEQARIIGIDLNPEALGWKTHGFEIYIGDQQNSVFWQDFYRTVGEFDVLLDDGGHTNSQQIQTLRCAIPHAKTGSTIVIEDTQTSYLADFGNPSRTSAVEYTKKLIDSISRRNPEILLEELELTRKIHSVQFFESLFAIHINVELSKVNREVDNGRGPGKASDFRYQSDACMELLLRRAIKKLAFRISLRVRFLRFLLVVPNFMIKSVQNVLVIILKIFLRQKYWYLLKN